MFYVISCEVVPNPADLTLLNSYVLFIGTSRIITTPGKVPLLRAVLLDILYEPEVDGIWRQFHIVPAV